MVWIFAGILVCISAAVSVRAHFRLVEITRTPTTPIGSVREGRVEIKGRVSDRSRLIRSPLCRERCAFYHMTIDEKDSDGDWGTIVDDKQAKRLVVEDETGAAVVDIENAQLILATDHYSRSGVLNDADPVQRRAQRRYGLSGAGWLFNRSLRYEESILKVGDELYVLGLAKPDPELPVVTDGLGPFIVTDSSEDSLTMRYQTRRFGGAVVALAIAVAIVMALFERGLLG